MIERDLKRIREAEHQAVLRMEGAADSCEERLGAAQKEGAKAVGDTVRSAKDTAEKEREARRQELEIEAKTIRSRAEMEADSITRRAKSRMNIGAKKVSDKILGR